MYQPFASVDYLPTATWANLRLRAELLGRLREFFDARGFLEVETPVLSADTVVDRHLDPFAASGQRVASGEWRVASETKTQDPRPKPQDHNLQISKSPNLQISKFPRLWLQTSPEFHMKRLLAAGAGRIYQVARVFRREELGPLHNPEFTLVEWYQPGEGMDEGMELTAELCAALLSDIKPRPAVAPIIKPRPAERLAYREAFERYVGVDPHAADGTALAAAAENRGIQSPASLKPDDRDGWLDLLLTELVQPHLGVERPTLLYDYPASQAALARLRQDPGRPPVAERFELFVAGIELANGYHELLDPAELRARIARTNALRIADGKPALPEESRLLAAMEAGLPPAVGVAFGFDRLVMLAAGAKSVAEVMAFPFDRA